MPASLPQPNVVSSTLSDLLGKNVSFKRSPPLVVGPRNLVTVAAYGTEADQPQILWVCEIGLACAMGAALSLIPAGVAAESAKKGQVEPNLRENLHEVMNVGASMLSGSGTRFTLQALHAPPGALPPPVAQLLARPPARLDLELTIAGYEPGKMALLAR